MTTTGASALRISSWPRRTRRGWQAAARILAWAGEAKSVVHPGIGVYLRGDGEAPALWQKFVGRTQLEVPSRAILPGSFDMAVYLRGRRLAWCGKIYETGETAVPEFRNFDPLAVLGRLVTPLRKGLLERITAALPPREAMLTASVLLGERDARVGDLRDSFTSLGLSHLFAVSGLHVGIIVGLLGALLVPLCPGPSLRFAAAVAVLPAYALITGMSGSVLRASEMVMLALAAPVLGRRFDPLHALAAVFWVTLLWTPAVVLDTGTRLSYLAVAGILALNRLFGPALRHLPAGAKWGVTGFGVTVGAQWLTVPQIASSFGRSPLASPLVNLAAVPAFSVAVWLGVIGLLIGSVWSWAGDAFLALSWFVWRLLQAAVGAGAEGLIWSLNWLPWSPGRTALYLGASVASVVAVRGRRVGFGLFAVCVIAAVLWWSSTGRRTAMRVTFLPVGQGDCTLLEFPDESRVLIDTAGFFGSTSVMKRSILPWLRRRTVRDVDSVVLTHGHDDHTGGAMDLASLIAVDRWYGGGRAFDALPEDDEIEKIMPVAGDVLHRAGEWRLRCLFPATAGGDSTRSENNRSLVLELRHGAEPACLWTGDLELEGEARLLEVVTATGGAFPVWQAGHHGSRTSGGRSFLDWARPGLVVVSCGVANRHHHPSHGPYICRDDTVGYLRTDLDGPVTCVWPAGGALQAPEICVGTDQMPWP